MATMPPSADPSSARPNSESVAEIRVLKSGMNAANPPQKTPTPINPAIGAWETLAANPIDIRLPSVQSALTAR
jgi:hypothetical protein